jgi:hypothetical protein
MMWRCGWRNKINAFNLLFAIYWQISLRTSEICSMFAMARKKLSRMQYALIFGFSLGFFMPLSKLSALMPLIMLGWLTAIAMARLADAGKPRWIGAWYFAASALLALYTFATGGDQSKPPSAATNVFVWLFFVFQLYLIVLPTHIEGALKVNRWRAAFLSRNERQQLQAKASEATQLLAGALPAQQAWQAEVDKLLKLNSELSEFQKSMNLPATPEQNEEFRQRLAAIHAQQAVCDQHREQFKPTQDALASSTKSLTGYMGDLGVIDKAA